MAIDRTYGVAVNKNGSASTTIASSTFTNVPPDCLMVAGIMLNNNSSITAPPGWSTLINDLGGDSNRSGGIFYRFARGGDAPSYQFTPTFGSSSLAAVNIGCFLGVDDTNPFADYGSAGSTSASSIPGPSLTAAVPDSVGVWWWGVDYSRSASGRPVSIPGSMQVNGGSSGTPNTSSASAGVNANSGFETFPGIGSTGARNGSVSVQGPCRSSACLLQPASDQVITGGFLPFFGR